MATPARAGMPSCNGRHDDGSHVAALTQLGAAEPASGVVVRRRSGANFVGGIEVPGLGFAA